MKVRELYDRLGQLIRDGYEDLSCYYSNEFDEQIYMMLTFVKRTRK